MQVSFSVMTHLDSELAVHVKSPVVFLGGSAPRLQISPVGRYSLSRISDTSFIRSWPHFSPTQLLTPDWLHSIWLRFGTLCIEISSPITSPEQTTRRSDSPMTAVLPALTQFKFRGEQLPGGPRDSNRHAGHAVLDSLN
jgi:hypothetical protein